MKLAAKAVGGMRARSDVPASEMAQEALFEYHLYTLARPTTIADNQTKQVALLGATGVPVTKELVLHGADYYYRSSVGGIGQKMKVGVFVQFENRESSRLGMPMPKGVVRVYKKDSAGNAQFIGEDSIDHTPKNEKVRLKLGDAFDVTADKKQTDFKRREPANNASYVFESAYEIVLRNAKKEPATVIVREPVPIAKDEPLRLELQHFVNCVREKLTPMVSGESAKRALDLALEISGKIKAEMIQA
jgi:hypothetical protein